MSRSELKLTEGIDYYIEAGCWVFTSTYHQKRGYCCENICRHCPYGNSPTDHEKTKIEDTSHPEQDST